MARAFKCDRCGSYFGIAYGQVDSDDTILFLCSSRTRMPSDMDLCPACYKELVDWFKKVNSKGESKNE